MTRRRHRPRVYGSKWEIAGRDCSCEYCPRTIHRGAPLLVVGPGRVRHCVPCAKARRKVEPPESMANATAKWTGPDGRALQLPEGDR
jgi:hypothetical protein